MGSWNPLKAVSDLGKSVTKAIDTGLHSVQDVVNPVVDSLGLKGVRVGLTDAAHAVAPAADFIAKFTPAAPLAYAYDAYDAARNGNPIGALANAALSAYGMPGTEQTGFANSDVLSNVQNMGNPITDLTGKIKSAFEYVTETPLQKAAAEELGAIDSAKASAALSGATDSEIAGATQKAVADSSSSYVPKGTLTALKDALPSSSTLLTGGLLASTLAGAPKPVQQAIPQLSASQQEYFNRPNVYWDWDKLQVDAIKAKTSLSDFMASHWNDIAGGKYNIQSKSTYQYAKGGEVRDVAALPQGSQGFMAHLAQGGGSGRDDTIDAKLSDGEYVIDSEAVAMLGDGSTKEGAKRLDEMRENLRKHKGSALKSGKISPNAKSPLAYLKGQ